MSNERAWHSCLIAHTSNRAFGALAVPSFEVHVSAREMAGVFQE